MTTRILVADDHDVVREGLKTIIEAERDLQVVGMADSGHDAIKMAAELSPDVVLMDIAMPGLNGIEATRIICEQAHNIKVIILSMYHTNEHVFRAVQAGAMGYVLKEAAGSNVVKAIRAVCKGLEYFCEGVEPPVLFRHTGPRKQLQSPIDSLSLREREVLQLVVEGRTSAEIAGLLSLSPKSVETYRSRMMQKLGINNIPALVRFALFHGITHS